MASGSAGEGAGSNTDKKTSKVVIMTPPVFATSLSLLAAHQGAGASYLKIVPMPWGESEP